MYFAPIVRTRATPAPALRAFDSGFERFVNEAFFSGTAGVSPQVREQEIAWTVTLDLPGVAREDLTINVEGPVVRIETRQEAARKFKATYELPQEIDVDATSAKLENGVLTLSLAKKVPVSNARQIPLS